LNTKNVGRPKLEDGLKVVRINTTIAPELKEFAEKEKLNYSKILSDEIRRIMKTRN